MALNWFDILILLVVALSALAGLREGFARVGFGLVSTIAGLLLGFWFYRVPAAWFRSFLPTDTAADIAGFLLIFIVVGFVGAMLAGTLANLFKWVGLSWFDHLLGGAVGLLRGALIVAALVAAIVSFAPTPTPAFLNESRMLPYTQRIAYVVIAAAPSDVREAFEKGVQELKRFRHELPEGQHPRTSGEV